MTAPVSAGAAAPLRIAIAGASGRMGRMLIEAVLDAPDLALSGALDMAGNPSLGQDAGDRDAKRGGAARGRGRGHGAAVSSGG